MIMKIILVQIVSSQVINDEHYKAIDYFNSQFRQMIETMKI